MITVGMPSEAVDRSPRRHLVEEEELRLLRRAGRLQSLRPDELCFEQQRDEARRHESDSPEHHSKHHCSCAPRDVPGRVKFLRSQDSPSFLFFCLLGILEQPLFFGGL